MEAILLVGGRGSRLRPLTSTTPKPMLPAGGVPFITHQLTRARDAGVEHVVLSTSYKAEVFQEHFGDGRNIGVELEYVTEDVPLGTGGGIRNVTGHLRSGADDPVLVLNGDILTGLDMRTIVQQHQDADADVTLHLTRVEDPRAFGLVPTDRNGKVQAFLEKPTRAEEIVTDQINAGCYVFKHSVLETIPAGRSVSVERETFPELLQKGREVLGYVDSSYWLDLGTPAAYVRGNVDLVLGNAPSSALQGPTGEHLILPDAQIGKGTRLTGGSVIGSGSRIGDGVVADGSVVFDDVTVEEGATIRNSAVGAGAVIGAGAVLVDAVIGDGAVIGAGCELQNGIRVAAGAVLGANSVRFSAES